MAVLKRYNGTTWEVPVLYRYDGATWECVNLNRHTGSDWENVETACASFQGAITDPLDIADCLQWLDVTQMASAPNDHLMDIWPNYSGNGQDGPSHWSSSVKPKYKTAANGINGKPTLWFDGIDDQLTYFADIFSGVTAATAFIVGRMENDPPGSVNRTGFWHFGSANSNVQIPYTDGVIYDDFCSTARKDTVNPVDSMASPYVYSVVSGPGDWRNYLNGTLLYSTATNTFGAKASCDIGVSPNPRAYHGHWGELIIYSRVLTEPERVAVETYLEDKWL
jgi:hypothetical protein